MLRSKKIKYLSSILLLSSGLSYADMVKITVVNNSGQPMSADLVSSAPNAALCNVTPTGAFTVAYNFAEKKWDTFKHDTSVIDLAVGEKYTTEIDTSCLVGGAQLFVAQGSKANNFNNNMTAVGSGSPNLALYQNVYDKIEMGYPNPTDPNQKVAGWNVTAVDFFGLPFQMTDGKKKVGFMDTDSQGNPVTRALINKVLKDSYDKNISMYDNRFFGPNANRENYARIFSPQHFYVGLENPTWSNAIRSDLTTLANIPGFEFQYGGFKYEEFTYTGGDSLSAKCSYASNPSVKYDCVLTGITVGNSVAGEIRYDKDPESLRGIRSNFAGMIATVINRGVLSTPEFWGTYGPVNTGDLVYKDWYKKLGLDGEAFFNVYAQVLTSFALDNKVYATSYEDFWSMDNSLQISPTNNDVTITVMPLE